MSLDDHLHRMLGRERWRSRRQFVPTSVRDYVRHWGRRSARTTTRWAWRLAQWWVAQQHRPPSELERQWSEFRWARSA